MLAMRHDLTWSSNYVTFTMCFEGSICKSLRLQWARCVGTGGRVDGPDPIHSRLNSFDKFVWEYERVAIVVLRCCIHVRCCNSIKYQLQRGGADIRQQQWASCGSYTWNDFRIGFNSSALSSTLGKRDYPEFGSSCSLEVLNLQRPVE